MRRYLIPIFVLFLIFFGGGVLLLNTTWISSASIPHSLATYFPGLKLESFKVGRQIFIPPNSLQLNNISLTVEQSGTKYEIMINQAAVDDMLSYLKLQKQMTLSLKGASVRWDMGAVDNLNAKFLVDFQPKRKMNVDGILAGKSLQVGRYLLKEFTTRLRGTEKKFQLFEFAAKGYGGTFRGQFDLELAPQSNYIFWLEFSGLSGAGLTVLDESLFGGVHGEIAGTLRLLGQDRQITLLAVSLTMPKGGTLDGALMRHLAEKYADEQQRAKILGGLESSPSQFPVDKAALNLHSTSEFRSECSFQLESKSNDLFLIRSVNLNLEKGFKHFLLEEDWQI